MEGRACLLHFRESALPQCKVGCWVLRGAAQQPCRLTQVCQAAPTERAPRSTTRAGSVAASALQTEGVSCGVKVRAAADPRAAKAAPSAVMAACCWRARLVEGLPDCRRPAGVWGQAKI